MTDRKTLKLKYSQSSVRRKAKLRAMREYGLTAKEYEAGQSVSDQEFWDRYGGRKT